MLGNKRIITIKIISNFLGSTENKVKNISLALFSTWKIFTYTDGYPHDSFGLNLIYNATPIHLPTNGNGLQLLDILSTNMKVKISCF